MSLGWINRTMEGTAASIEDVQILNSTGQVMIKGDNASPVNRDLRTRKEGIYLVDERHNGSTWEEINRVGGSIVIPRSEMNKKN